MTSMESGMAEEEDPTKPVLFSLRDEYRNLRSDAWSHAVLLRLDRLVLKNLGTRAVRRACS